MSGEPTAETKEDREWLNYIKNLHARGIPFERVRVLDEPPTTYQRWIITTTDANVAAGEDIRWLARRDAQAAGMPNYDFYIFDENRVAIMRFDAHGELTGIELDDDPAVVSEHLAYRARVWPVATTHRQGGP